MCFSEGVSAITKKIQVYQDVSNHLVDNLNCSVNTNCTLIPVCVSSNLGTQIHSNTLFTQETNNELFSG